jgi:predicted DNA-binding transcriptional regulator AlpA
LPGKVESAMVDTTLTNGTNAPVQAAFAGRRLIGIDRVCPGKVAMSKRGWLRLCDSGRAPWGIKLGARRVWDETELDAWIASGCRPVRTVKGGAA